jgi:AAA family ATP:ADP antiporter
MDLGAFFLKGVGREARIKAALLGSWFFVTVATLWLLKPVRVASLLANLGARETPYVRLAGVVAIAVVVALYSIVVNRLSRINVVRWANLLFGALLVLFWLAIQLGGPWLVAQRAFVWAVYILVELYSAILIGIFWTYTNDVVSSDEANKLYGFIGLGGILGGIAGGAFVDLFSRGIGTSNLLLVCTGLVVLSAVFASIIEVVVHPPERHPQHRHVRGVARALEGANEVRKSRYLLLIVGIVVAYEVSATLADFGVNVLFQNEYRDEAMLTQMYGRLGWIVGATAIVGQIVFVPLLLPSKRIALLVPPLVMLASAAGVVILPIIATAVVLAAADRGLNYSIQQATMESLYVPLSDAQKYRAKAFISMFVDRAAKALAAFALIIVIQTAGESVRASLIVSVMAMIVWLGSARRLGALWALTWGLRDAPAVPAPAEKTDVVHAAEAHP